MIARRALAAAFAAALLLCPAAKAAGPPLIKKSWVEGVSATGADLRALISPNGFPTTYRFEYVTQAAFEQSGFSGAIKAPPSGSAPLGSGNSTLEVTQHIGGLTPITAYRYRAVATNSAGTETGPENMLTTQESSLSSRLPDDRGWELVSPIHKGGGAIASPGSLFGGGEFQAGAQGSAVTYGSATAFAEAQGAPPASQYLSTRTTGGWITKNLSAPLQSAAYGDKPDGAPYRLFSSDLSTSLLFGGLPCRGGIAGCPEPNPVLPGSGAPSGFMAYYLRDGSGSFFSLLKAVDLSHTSVSPAAFEVSFAASSSDLSHVVLSSCAALTANATEVLSGPGECDPEEQNLYERSASGLRLINLLPADTNGTPGASIAAPIGAVSEDGSRIYWSQGGNLYLRDGTQSVQVDQAQGGGGAFQAASADGSLALFTKAGHLYRFLAATKAATDLTPAGGVVGVLGASADGGDLYYQDASGIQRWQEGAITQVAFGAEASLPSNYPPATGTSRVSPDGEHLAFLSKGELTGYDNAGETELFLYGPPPGGGAAQLICASCNPTGERPQGEASIPGALINGSTRAYRPRALSDNGNRLFFNSTDELAPQDTNSQPDVYQWEAKGIGDCQVGPGCLKLISSGRSPEGASFIDASADGADAFFITDGSLVSIDPGSIDLYDARVGGGFSIPPKPIPCIADACQSLPPTPEDPDPGTLVKSPANPELSFDKERKKKKGKGQRQGGKGKKKGKRKFGEGKFHVTLRAKEEKR